MMLILYLRFERSTGAVFSITGAVVPSIHKTLDFNRRTSLCRAVTESAALVFFAMMFFRYRYVLNNPTTTPKISSSPLGRMTG
jgi:hypothetical protein